MPKLKTRRGVAKRFKITKKGKVKAKKAGRGHLLTRKSRKRIRSLGKTAVLGKTQAEEIRQLLPYG